MPEETSDDHYVRLHREHGEGLTEEQHSIVFGFAYNEGHWAGMDEVEEEYKGAADLARDLLKTVR